MKRIAVTGNFDGCHLAHREIFNRLKLKAEEVGAEPLVITFDPNPKIFFHPNKGIKLLTTTAEKKDIVEDLELKMEALTFSDEFRKLSQCEYLEKILVGQYDVKYWMMGFNHSFGYQAKNKNDEFHACAERLGVELIDVEKMEYEDETISSTYIRKLLNDGDVVKANKLLGYEFSLRGKVIPGDQRGRTIGFPTANIDIQNEYKLVPKNGVYGGRCTISGQEYLCAINIGTQPTFSGKSKRIEVHILDFKENIYSQELVLKLDFPIRNELFFSSTEELIEQINKDILFIKQQSKPV